MTEVTTKIYPDIGNKAVFVRKQKDISPDVLLSQTGSINKKKWFGFGAETWQMNIKTISWEDKWVIVFMFFWRPEGWQPRIVIDEIDKIEKIRTYREFDFNTLGLTEEEWVRPGPDGIVTSKDIDKAIQRLK